MAAVDFLDGVPVYRLEGSAGDYPEPAELIVIWVNIDDLLPLRVQLDRHADVGTYEGLVPDDLRELFEASVWNLSQFNEPVEVTAPEVKAIPTSFATPFGPMMLYESAQYPFAIQHPADWAEQPPQVGVTSSFAGESGGVLVIAEEDLVAIGIGVTNIQTYVDILISVISTRTPDFQLESREQVVTSQGLSAEILVFTTQAGLLKSSRLIYLHEGKIGFSATYLAPKAQYEELQPVITFSFSTFQVSVSS